MTALNVAIVLIWVMLGLTLVSLLMTLVLHAPWIVVLGVIVAIFIFCTRPIKEEE